MSGQERAFMASVLRNISHGESATNILRSVCLDAELRLPGTLVGVTILDRSSQVFEDAIFPLLSDQYAEALKGINVADKPGSCALAVSEGQPVICDDIATDARFSDAWKSLGTAHGLASLMSIPLMQMDGLA